MDPLPPSEHQPVLITDPTVVNAVISGVLCDYPPLGLRHRLRLLNVAQVRVNANGFETDLRPTMVEILTSEECCVVVMLRLADPRDTTKLDPVLIGRLSLPAPFEITDALGWDGQNWALESAGVRVLIRPYKEEHLWLDPAFTDPAPTALALSLYDELRMCKLSLVGHRRMWQGTPNNLPAIRNAHEVVIKAMSDKIKAIEAQLSALNQE